MAKPKRKKNVCLISGYKKPDFLGEKILSTKLDRANADVGKLGQIK